MLFLILYLMALFFASLYTLLRRATLSRCQTTEMFLLHLFVFSYGFAGLIGFIGHGLRPEETAARIGWPAHRQFQFEIVLLR